MNRLYGILIIIILVSTNTNATTMSYSGVINNINYGQNPAYPLAEVGDIINGTFTYHPQGVSDSNSWDAVGEYYFNDQNSYFTIDIYDSSENGGLIYSQTGYLRKILTENNWQYTPNPSLYPTIDAFTPIALLGNGAEVFLRYQNRNTNLDVITSDELPLIPPLFDQFNYTTGSLAPANTIGQIDFSLTSLTPVPLPPSFVFLITGLISIFSFRRRNFQVKNMS